ncbi:MAG: DUF262 domain-containing protein [Gammaproteobacteria bacterium]|nr:DUF262 domain-containing protein [Gammaproteobacteria bacterium]
MSAFDSTKTPLPDIIKEITDGKLQLPDFQRGWIWDDDHIRALLVSIARSFPVGAVMLLETGGDIRFQVRPVEGVMFDGVSPTPDRLILDGQQRLTSLTQVLVLSQQKPVQTKNDKGRPIKRYYYFDIEEALQDDRLEESLIATDENRQIKGNFGREIVMDLSTPEKECEAFFFPCSQIINSDEWEESLQKFSPDKFGRYMQFRKKTLNAFRNYQLPVIELGKTTGKEAVCLVFEKVNTGGVPLSVFELVTATFAADGFNLRDDWYGNAQRDQEGRSECLKREPILETIEPTDFLQAVSLLHTHKRRQDDVDAGKTGKSVSAVSAKRGAVLSLPLAEYERWAPEVEEGFLLTAKFLRRECFYKSRDLPYRTQIIALAALLTKLKERWLERKISDYLVRWFWCGVLGELYGGSSETRIANDFEEVLPWVLSNHDDGGSDNNLPRTVSEASFQANRLDTLRSRVSAAYKGLSILVLRAGAQDFFWKETVQKLDMEEVGLDIHHIFPQVWCKSKGITKQKYDSIINKTPISYKANRIIGGSAPSDYFKVLQQKTGLSEDEMVRIIESHKIDSEALRRDDFDGFYKRRRQSLLSIVENAMAKKVQHDSED